MEKAIADLLPTLQDALQRLAQHVSTADGDAAHGHLRDARDHVELAVAALSAAQALAAASPQAAAPSAPPVRLADRIVLIETPALNEPFRTRIKIKTTEPVEHLAASATAAAEPAAAAPLLPVADDLTRLRGIDRNLARRLAAHGVTSFEAIASWSHIDVRRVAAALDLGRQISRQNWIEQAALLAPIPPVRPAVAVIAAPVPVAPIEPEPVPAYYVASTMPVAVEPEVADVEASGLAATIDVHSSIVAAVAQDLVPTANIGSAPAEPVPVDAAAAIIAVPVVTEPIPAYALVESVVEPPQPIPEAPVSLLEPDLPIIPGAPEPEIVVGAPRPILPPDRLEFISGINAAMATALQTAGVSRWDEIAAWRRADLERLAHRVGPAAEVARQGWIEQAAILATGRLTTYARRVGDGDFAALVPCPADEPLAAPAFTPWHLPAPAIDQAPAMAIAIAGPTPELDCVPITNTEQTGRSANDDELLLLPVAHIDARVPQPVTNVPVAAVAPPFETIEQPAPAPGGVTAKLEDVLAAQVANDTAARRTLIEERPGAAPSPSPATSRMLHVEDEEFPELSVSEAEVSIIARPSPLLVPAMRSDRATPSARSLLSRLRRTAPIDDIDAGTYAAYRDQVEEASVEIVKPGAKGR